MGLEALQPHEIIEFLLYYAIPRQDVNDLAHSLIDRFGTVEAVLHAEIPELTRVEGMGRRTAEFLAWVGEVADACAAMGSADRLQIGNFLDVFRYACGASRTLTPPCCMQICLDRSCRILYQCMICPSRAWGEADTMRSALRDVLSTGARSVILLEFVGNLRSDPEEYDLSHVRDYAATLHAAGSALLDLLIIGDGGSCSLRQLGKIPDFDLSERARSVREDYLLNMPADISHLRVQDFMPAEEEEDSDADSN